MNNAFAIAPPTLSEVDRTRYAVPGTSEAENPRTIDGERRELWQRCCPEAVGNGRRSAPGAGRQPPTACDRSRPAGRRVTAEAETVSGTAPPLTKPRADGVATPQRLQRAFRNMTGHGLMPLRKLESCSQTARKLTTVYPCSFDRTAAT